MKNFYEMYSLLKESTDEILNGLIKHIRDSNYEPWTFAMLADYFEKIGDIKSTNDFRGIAENVHNIRDRKYLPSTFTMFANYLEEIGNINSANYFRAIALRMQSLEREMKINRIFRQYYLYYVRQGEFELRNGLADLINLNKLTLKDPEYLKLRMINLIKSHMPTAKESDIEAGIKLYAYKNASSNTHDTLMKIYLSSPYQKGEPMNTRVKDESFSIREIYKMLDSTGGGMFDVPPYPLY